MRVLVVDDEETGRYLLEAIFRSRGDDVVTAVDGLDALKRAREDRPDVVVTDVLMPRMDGYKLCVRLRSDPELRDVPIVVYTASFGDEADKRFARSLGVDTFLIKPQEPDVILSAVDRLLGAVHGEAQAVLPPEDDSDVLREYGERISNKLYEKLSELERANAELSETTVALSREIAAKDELVEELSRAMTKEREAEEALLISQERYVAAMRGANDGIWDWDLATGSFFGSPRFRELLGFRDDEPLVRVDQWLDRTMPEDADRVRFEIDLHLKGLTPHLEMEYRIVGSDGTPRWISVRGQALRRREGDPYRMAGSLSDVNDRKMAEEQLLRNALYDELTGLPNRSLYQDRLRFLYQRREHDPGLRFAVLYLDLDRFKSVNESFGHAAGDEVLRAAGARLAAIARRGDTVARFGGDEFAVLVDAIEDPTEAERTADRVVAAFREPFLVDGQRIVLTASIGISVSDGPEKRAEDLMRDAETAMFRAKKAGGCRFELFDAAMHAMAVKALHTEAELRVAIERGELEPYYQPVVSLATGEIVSCEALCRWNHPSRGLLGPAEFIQVADETGLIVPLAAAVMREACGRAKQWHDEGLGPIRMSVNVSARQFGEPGLLDMIRSTLLDTGLPAKALVLELTESTVMADPAEAAVLLTALDALGVQLSVDDFGTGYSSLSYLKKFPFGTLKIDRSFVMEIPHDTDDLAIVNAVVGMAHSLKMAVTAEGVETFEQIEYLRSIGCDHIQGFYVSRPVPAADMRRMLVEGVSIERH